MVEVRLVSGSDTRLKTGPTGGSRLAVALVRGAALSATAVKGRGCWLSSWAARWADLALGRSKEEKGGRGKRCGPRGRKGWAKPEAGEKNKEKPFLISEFKSCSNILKRKAKPV